MRQGFQMEKKPSVARHVAGKLHGATVGHDAIEFAFWLLAGIHETHAPDETRVPFAAPAGGMRAGDVNERLHG